MRLKRGRIKLDEALDVALQTAFAISAAHEAGIVHRDIKQTVKDLLADLRALKQEREFRERLGSTT